MPKPTFRKKSVDDDNNISKFSDEKISVGDIRKTQVITTFGVGSIVDFKDDMAIITGMTGATLIGEQNGTHMVMTTVSKWKITS